MTQSREEIENNLMERLCWVVARRDDSRVARRLYRKETVDGVYRLDAPALLDGFFYFLKEVGVFSLMEQLHGEDVRRQMVDFLQYVLLHELKTLLGIESMNALPELLFSDAAAMRLVGFNARQVQRGVCQRGAAQRDGPREDGPICPDTLANNILKLSLEAMAQFLNQVVQALAKAGVFARQLTGILDGTDLETTPKYQGCGKVTRKKKVVDKRGRAWEIEVSVYGFKLIVLIDARSKIPLAAKVVQIQQHEVNFLRELVQQAQHNLGKYATLKKLVCDKGFLDGAELWWLNEQGIIFVVPGKKDMAVVADARALAEAGEAVYLGRRTRSVTHGQGKTRWREELETEVVDIEGLTTYDQYGTAEQAKQAHRKDFQGNPINGVVVRKWDGHDYGPGGKRVFLTNGPVSKPLGVFDDYDDRSLIENCCIKESKQQWTLGHPPKKNEGAVKVHVLFTLVMFALATAYRLLCEEAELGKEPVGWQRWRRQLLQQNRDKVIVFAGDCYGIFHLAEYSILLGLDLKDLPLGMDSREAVLAKFGIKDCP
jgi:hypothetical protein